MMLEFWRGLGASLEKNGTWTDAQRSLALDLLGIHPAAPATPRPPPSRPRGRLRGPPDGWVASEIGRLTDLRDGVLAESDAHERALAEATIGAELTKPLQLMHRYERAAWSRQQWARRKLDAARKARGEDAAPPVRDEPEPAPAAPAGTGSARARPAASFVAIRVTPTVPVVDRAPSEAVPAPASARALNRRERRTEAGAGPPKPALRALAAPPRSPSRTEGDAPPPRRTGPPRARVTESRRFPLQPIRNDTCQPSRRPVRPPKSARTLRPPRPYYQGGPPRPIRTERTRILDRANPIGLADVGNWGSRGLDRMVE